MDAVSSSRAPEWCMAEEVMRNASVPKDCSSRRALSLDRGLVPAQRWAPYPEIWKGSGWRVDGGWMEGGWRVDGGWMEGGWRVDGGLDAGVDGWRSGCRSGWMEGGRKKEESMEGGRE